MTTFQELLEMPGSELKPPKPLPVGTYVCLIDGVPQFGQVGEKKTDVVDFTAKVLQPHTDVDPQALAEYDDGVMGKTIRLRYFGTKDAIHRLNTFLHDHLGIEDGPLKRMISEASGRQVYVMVKHRSVIEGTTVNVYTDVAGTARI